MLKKAIHHIACIFLIITTSFLCAGPAFSSGEAQETIFYEISPLGESVYQDLGIVEFRGRKANLVVFKTQAPGFKDTEKIYSHPETHLPLWVERDLTILLSKEFLTEEYLEDENRLVITKFKNGKKTDVYQFKENAPIHNAVLIPFSLRKIPDLQIGWTSDIRFPDEFEVRLVSIEDVTVPAGKFKSFHFTSMPRKFEIWISADTLRLPVKIKGLGGIPYTLMMKKYTNQQKKP